MSLSIALAQMSLNRAEPKTNSQKADNWVRKASDQGAEIVLLPELWASGFDLKNCEIYGTPIHEGIFADMRSMAEKYNIVVGGSLIEREDDAFYNTFVLYSASGELIASYRKVHLFAMLEEDIYFQAGNQLVLVESDWGKIGLATCYDLRFPELFRALAVKGAGLILLVAEWPQRRVAHWQRLLQSRAIENQCFLAAVNKVGESQGEELSGYSTVINPMGEYLAQGGEDEELLLASIDLKEVDKIRRWMPVLQDRKPAAYQTFLNE
jgi:predicted amidohydrolase